VAIFPRLRTADSGGSCIELRSLRSIRTSCRSALRKRRRRLCCGPGNCFRQPAITAKRQRLWTTSCTLCTLCEATTKFWERPKYAFLLALKVFRDLQATPVNHAISCASLQARYAANWCGNKQSESLTL